jgi:hypothetical protein
MRRAVSRQDIVSLRPSRARVHSLCGTARGIASKQNASAARHVVRKPCRYAAIWTCQVSSDCSRRMSDRR